MRSAISQAVFRSYLLKNLPQSCSNYSRRDAITLIWCLQAHVVPQILDALIIAHARGLEVPVVYNSSGYEAENTLAILDGVIDIYMPDFKFWSAKSSKIYCNAENYPDVARNALS